MQINGGRGVVDYIDGLVAGSVVCQVAPIASRCCPRADEREAAGSGSCCVDGVMVGVSQWIECGVWIANIFDGRCGIPSGARVGICIAVLITVYSVVRGTGDVD